MLKQHRRYGRYAWPRRAWAWIDRHGVDRAAQIGPTVMPARRFRQLGMEAQNGHNHDEQDNCCRNDDRWREVFHRDHLIQSEPLVTSGGRARASIRSERQGTPAPAPQTNAGQYECSSALWVMAWPAAEMSFPAPAVVWQAVMSRRIAKLTAAIALKLRMGHSLGQDMAFVRARGTLDRVQSRSNFRIKCWGTHRAARNRHLIYLLLLASS